MLQQQLLNNISTTKQYIHYASIFLFRYRKYVTYCEAQFSVRHIWRNGW